jgi:hypothetical protein
MIEFKENTENKYCEVTSDKMVQKIIIKKASDGFIFFDITLEKGVTPHELSGKFTSLDKAKTAVFNYLKNKKETQAAKREYYAEEARKRKAKKEVS